MGGNVVCMPFFAKISVSEAHLKMSQLRGSFRFFRNYSTLGPTDIYVTSNVNLRRKAGIKPLNGVQVWFFLNRNYLKWAFLI